MEIRLDRFSIELKVPELVPILEKAAQLSEYPNARFVYEAILEIVTRANSPSMGQSACERIITMCHPKGWGDQLVGSFGTHEFAWINFLGELSDIANKSGQQIFDNSNRSASGS